MSGRSRRGATALSLVILVVMSLSPILIDGLNETALFRSASSRSTNCSGVCINEMMPDAVGSDEGAEDARARTEGRDDGSHGSIRLDGFGFESVTRDEVQGMLDQGHTIEEVRAKLGEEE